MLKCSAEKAKLECLSKSRAPSASQGKCCKILELDHHYFSAKIESHLAFRTISRQGKPIKRNVK